MFVWRLLFAYWLVLLEGLEDDEATSAYVCAPSDLSDLTFHTLLGLAFAFAFSSTFSFIKSRDCLTPKLAPLISIEVSLSDVSCRLSALDFFFCSFLTLIRNLSLISLMFCSLSRSWASFSWSSRSFGFENCFRLVGVAIGTGLSLQHVTWRAGGGYKYIAWL